MNKLKPISTAPKDREILIAWGSKAAGCEGFTVGRSVRIRVPVYKTEYKAEIDSWAWKDVWVDETENKIESNGYCIFGWTDLPELPREIVVD